MVSVFVPLTPAKHSYRLKRQISVTIRMVERKNEADARANLRVRTFICERQVLILPEPFVTKFPCKQRSLTKRQNEWMERPLPASDALFDEAADQISGRNLQVLKTGSVYCVSGVPHKILFLFFRLLLLSLNLIYS